MSPQPAITRRSNIIPSGNSGQYDSNSQTSFAPGSELELQMTEAPVDWAKSCVDCRLTPEGEGKTRVLFYHNGWPEANEHWRASCYCWAMYLRVLRRNVEHRESAQHEKRLEV
jgi:hypothetical protein